METVALALQTPSDADRLSTLCLQEVDRIGRRFLSGAQKAADGSVFWLKPARSLEVEEKPARLGPHLHAGYSGITLFLSALGHVVDDAQYRDLALRTLSPLRRYLKQLTCTPSAAANRQFRLGAVTGLGSFIYTFVRVSPWLDEPQLLEEACEVATLITPEQIAADTSIDLMYGSAGALLALLLLEEAAPERLKERNRLLDRAINCGEFLLKKRVAAPGEPRGWPNAVQPPCSGFAHGASGIIYALTRLAHRTGREDFWKAALEGIAFERLQYSPEHRNWLPVRSRPTRLLLNSWCNGAAGIALSRFSLPMGQDLPQIREDLDLALASVLQEDEAVVDFLCCGNMGRADILLQASRLLGRVDLLRAAHEMAAQVIENARARPGGYRTNYQDQLNPSFYVGLSGIGYVLLRLSGVPNLPCVLAVE
jgi:lantibiotic modifying enzyme